MKARITATIVAIFLFAATAAARPSDLLRSTRPLQIQHAMMTISADSDGVRHVDVDVHKDTICTVSSINERKHYWITAHHCVEDRNLTYFIDNDVVTVEMRDVRNDLAILSTATAYAPALKLAKKGPTFGDKVTVAGYPLGFGPLLTQGFVANPSLQITDEKPYDRPFMFVQAAGAPGNSGSPIVNSHNELVSVLQISFGRTFGPIMGGATYEILSKYAEYWSRK